MSEAGKNKFFNASPYFFFVRMIDKLRHFSEIFMAVVNKPYSFDLRDEVIRKQCIEVISEKDIGFGKEQIPEKMPKTY